MEGINELTISNAAYLSSWKGNVEIEIPFDSEEFDQKLLSLSNKSTKHNNGSNDSASSEYKERWKVRW